MERNNRQGTYYPEVPASRRELGPTTYCDHINYLPADVAKRNFGDDAREYLNTQYLFLRAPEGGREWYEVYSLKADGSKGPALGVQMMYSKEETTLPPDFGFKSDEEWAAHEENLKNTPEKAASALLNLLSDLFNDGDLFSLFNSLSQQSRAIYLRYFGKTALSPNRPTVSFLIGENITSESWFWEAIQKARPESSSEINKVASLFLQPTAASLMEDINLQADVIKTVVDTGVTEEARANLLELLSRLFDDQEMLRLLSSVSSQSKEIHDYCDAKRGDPDPRQKVVSFLIKEGITSKSWFWEAIQKARPLFPTQIAQTKRGFTQNS